MQLIWLRNWIVLFHLILINFNFKANTQFSYWWIFKHLLTIWVCKSTFFQWKFSIWIQICKIYTRPKRLHMRKKSSYFINNFDWLHIEIIKFWNYWVSSLPLLMWLLEIFKVHVWPTSHSYQVGLLESLFTQSMVHDQ